MNSFWSKWATNSVFVQVASFIVKFCTSSLFLSEFREVCLPELVRNTMTACPRYYLFCWTNLKRSDTKPKKLSCCCRNQFNTAIASAISESSSGCGSKGAKHTGSILYYIAWTQKLLRVGGWIRSKTVLQSPDFRSWIVFRIISQCVWNNSLKSSLLSALKLSETTANPNSRKRFSTKIDYQLVLALRFQTVWLTLTSTIHCKTLLSKIQPLKGPRMRSEKFENLKSRTQLCSNGVQLRNVCWSGDFGFHRTC